jgi:YggT family protein
MGNPALGALGFIFGTILNVYAMVVALRFVMQVTRADYYNPLAQFVVKATDPLLVPLRRVIPSIKRYDTASALLCFGVLLVKLLVFKLMSLGYVPAIGRSLPVDAIPVAKLVIVALIDLVHLFFNIFIFSLFIQAILSWIPNASGNPVQGLLSAITEPVLRPARRFIPPMGGLDLSVFATIIGLYALRMFVVGTLLNILL